MKKLFGAWFILIIVLNICFGWIAGSAITSGIKAGTQSCGKRYVVEAVFSGDWFCPAKE